MRFSKEVADEAEKELEQIIARPTPVSLSQPLPIARTQSPSPRSDRLLGFNLISSAEEPIPPILALRRTSSNGGGSPLRSPPFSPAISRAQNPITANTPFRDESLAYLAKEGAELGLLSVSPPQRDSFRFGRVH